MQSAGCSVTDWQPSRAGAQPNGSHEPQTRQQCGWLTWVEFEAGQQQLSHNLKQDGVGGQAAMAVSGAWALALLCTTSLGHAVAAVRLTASSSGDVGGGRSSEQQQQCHAAAAGGSRASPGARSQTAR